MQNGSVIPPVDIGLIPIVEAHGNYYYPPHLWPGSVVGKLYDLLEELADTFDWPGRDAAAWFVLTGKAPEVRPLEVKWNTKGGNYLSPQWRIQLSIPP